ncbi:MAG TPA: substrate-binding domain-containing protein [Acidiferrobacteraceae bacterium]|nr:substrate-binding domain-containing protein [Acidiferrobacteraceae bacterium]
MQKPFWALLAPAIALATLPALVRAQSVPQIPGAPRILGRPVLDTPRLLHWPLNRAPAKADLTDAASDTVVDLHAEVQDCRDMDLVFSTEGNYHMALHTLWHGYLLPQYGKTIRNWYYTTSPPVALPQIKFHDFSIGNVHLACRPELAVASIKVMNKLKAAGLTDGKPVEIMQSRGNVLLVKRGNPKHIHSIWDLGRPDVHVVTPNPYNEPGAFINYATTIYEVAAHDPHPPRGWTAARLYNAIFNSRIKDKWLMGARIHHRDEPWSVADGRADVAVIMYQLGAYTARVLPQDFSLVPLGGTIANPRPLPGSYISKAYMVKIKGHWTARQIQARDDLIRLLQSESFTKILKRDGLSRP